MRACDRMPFKCVLGPFVGDAYTMECPQCAIGTTYREQDGAVLRQRPIWKTCELGHKFLVCLDGTPAVLECVSFVDRSEHAHPMEQSQKRARKHMSRAEMFAVIDAAPAPVAGCPRAKSPPLPSTLMRLLATPSPAAAGGGGGGGLPATVVSKVSSSRAKRRCDSDDEDVDIDAALRTMGEIAPEAAAPEPDSD